jgi:dTDP-glucose 4,6-dehydratase
VVTSLQLKDAADALPRGFLKGQRILVTGATGFVGKALIKALVRHSDHVGKPDIVFLLSRGKGPESKELLHSRGIESNHVRIDVRNLTPEHLPEVDLVVHGANSALSDVDRLQVIVDGTRALVDTLAVNSSSAHVVHLSSGAVYEKRLDSTLIEENDPLVPQAEADPYSLAKVSAERLLSNWVARSRDSSVLHARLFAFVGKELPREAHYAVGNFLSDGEARRPVRVLGSGTPLRSYMLDEELGIWLLASTATRQTSVMNVGSPHGLTLREVAQKISRRFSVGLVVEGDATKDGPRRFYVPSTSHAQHLLGLPPPMDLDQVLNRMLSRNGGRMT